VDQAQHRIRGRKNEGNDSAGRNVPDHKDCAENSGRLFATRDTFRRVFLRLEMFSGQPNRLLKNQRQVIPKYKVSLTEEYDNFLFPPAATVSVSRQS
jgi:hypothetical protein